MYYIFHCLVLLNFLFLVCLSRFNLTWAILYKISFMQDLFTLRQGGAESFYIHTAVSHVERLTINNIYNGNIFPSLNPAKIFQFISRWIESTKSSVVWPNHRVVINTSNEVKSPLLWEFWIYNFSLRILERVLGWKHCKYKEWVSFFSGFMGNES